MEKNKTKEVKIYECQMCGKIFKELLKGNKECLESKRTGKPEPTEKELDSIICGCCYSRETFKIHPLPENYDDDQILVEILKKRLVK